MHHMSNLLLDKVVWMIRYCVDDSKVQDHINVRASTIAYI